MNFKRTVMTTVIALMVCAGAANAAGIGYVDYSKVSTQYSLAKKYTADLDNKVNSIKVYAEAQQKKANAAKTAAEKKTITDAAVKQIKVKQQEYANARTKYENELTQKVVAAAEKVRISKGLDIIVKKDSRVTGGVDCTADVLNILK